MKELKQLGPDNIVIAIAGNKSDLEEKRVRSQTAASLSSSVWDKRAWWCLKTNYCLTLLFVCLFVCLYGRMYVCVCAGSTSIAGARVR